MTNIELDQALLNVLKSLLVTRHINNSGICVNCITSIRRADKGVVPDDVMYEKILWVSARFKTIFKDLGYRDLGYPVRHPTKSNFEAYEGVSDHWDLTTEYGRNRMKLLNEMIEYLEKILATESADVSVEA